ncbi:MAG: 5-formyltetrahydrofolate cyclo-ligase [Succinivibrionaceae bacterium]|nr:5-formyltetrahydrofolate cyclo-ligase [Succinivibrionaceae bacterium]
MRNQIRKRIRQLRRELSAEEQAEAAKSLLAQLKAIPGLFSFNSYALYLPSDGEIDTAPIVDELRRSSSELYLPVIDPDLPHAMTFRRYDEFSTLTPNRYGILEPDEENQTIAPDDLDVIFAPLVAFDSRGNRLGMGGGYYDSLISSLRQSGREVLVIGLAHNCQKVEELPVCAWDQPISVIATPDAVYEFKQVKEHESE